MLFFLYFSSKCLWYAFLPFISSASIESEGTTPNILITISGISISSCSIFFSFFSKRFKYASTSFVKSVPFLLAYLCASSKRYLSNVSAFVSILCPIMMLYIANLIIKFETNKQKLSIFQTSSSCHLPKLQSAIAFNMLLVCSNAIEALSSHTVADCVKFFVRSLAQRWAWSFAVDGVYHHF